MTIVKSFFLVSIVCFTSHIATAQTNAASNQANKWESNSYTYGEFKIGYGVTQFSTGLSERFENGNFSTSGGSLASIVAYRKFNKINYVHFGLRHQMEIMAKKCFLIFGEPLFR